MMWFLRGCPTCGGDLHEDPTDAELAQCLLCGRVILAVDLRRPTPAHESREPSAIDSGNRIAAPAMVGL
jgi:hypothetical protein